MYSRVGGVMGFALGVGSSTLAALFLVLTLQHGLFRRRFEAAVALWEPPQEGAHANEAEAEV